MLSGDVQDQRKTRTRANYMRPAPGTSGNVAWAFGSALYVFLQVGRVKHHSYVAGIRIVYHSSNVRPEQEPLLFIGYLGKELLEIREELECLGRVDCQRNRLLLSCLVQTGPLGFDVGP
jgi:hypothetical protein